MVVVVVVVVVFAVVGTKQAPLASFICPATGQPAVETQALPFQYESTGQPPTGAVGAVGVVVVGVVGAQKVPFQAVFGPQPPGGGLGAVGVVVVVGGTGQALVTGITEPFQHVWVETGGGTGGATVGAGPPCPSQEEVVSVPSLHRKAWAPGAAKPNRPVNMIDSARRSEEAALKRFMTSSKAGVSWVKVTLFPSSPRRGQIGISL